MFDMQAIEKLDVVTQVSVGLSWVFVLGWGLGLLVGLMLRAGGRGRLKLSPPWWSLLALWTAIALVTREVPIFQFGAFALVVSALIPAFAVRFDPFGEYRLQDAPSAVESNEVDKVPANAGSLQRFLVTTEVHTCPGVFLRAFLSVMCLFAAWQLRYFELAQDADAEGRGLTREVICLLCLGGALAVWACAAGYACFKSRKSAGDTEGR